jgi:hypothetical protein
MKLLGQTTITTAEDVAEARQLIGQIDSPADNQALFMALVRFVALVAKF